MTISDWTVGDWISNFVNLMAWLALFLLVFDWVRRSEPDAGEEASVLELKFNQFVSFIRTKLLLISTLLIMLIIVYVSRFIAFSYQIKWEASKNPATGEIFEGDLATILQSLSVYNLFSILSLMLLFMTVVSIGQEKRSDYNLFLAALTLIGVGHNILFKGVII